MILNLYARKIRIVDLAINAANNDFGERGTLFPAQCGTTPDTCLVTV